MPPPGDATVGDDALESFNISEGHREQTKMNKVRRLCICTPPQSALFLFQKLCTPHFISVLAYCPKLPGAAAVFHQVTHYSPESRFVKIEARTWLRLRYLKNWISLVRATTN